MHKRQLKKTGHQLRKPPNSIAHKFALYEPAHGNRRPERPAISYKDHIAAVIDPVNRPTSQEITAHAQDRDNWARLVKDRTKP